MSYWEIAQAAYGDANETPDREDAMLLYLQSIAASLLELATPVKDKDA